MIFAVSLYRWFPEFRPNVLPLGYQDSCSSLTPSKTVKMGKKDANKTQQLYTDEKSSCVPELIWCVLT